MSQFSQNGRFGSLRLAKQAVWYPHLPKSEPCPRRCRDKALPAGKGPCKGATKVAPPTGSLLKLPRVLGDDGLDVAGHVLEVGYLYILVDGMEVGHADAEGDGVGALRAEDVRVGPAAGGGVAGLKAASGRSGLQMRDDGVAGLVHDSR